MLQTRKQHGKTECEAFASTKLTSDSSLQTRILMQFLIYKITSQMTCLGVGLNIAPKSNKDYHHC